MSSSDERVESRQSTQKTGLQPVTRACDQCRAMKVRCIPDQTKKGICQRCAGTNRECIFKPIKTKRKKRTDTRVAELEREVQAMRTLLGQTSSSVSSDSKTGDLANFELATVRNANSQQTNESLPSGLEQNQDFQTSTVAAAPLEIPYATDDVLVCGDDTVEDPNVHLISPFSPFSAQDNKDLDVIHRGLLTMDTARILFDIYTNDILALSPFVLVPQGTTAGDMRLSKPILFLAILAAASGKYDIGLYKTLNWEIRQAFATSLFAEKSLQLTQALMVTAAWLYPPASCRQVKFYEYIHMSATMALDIGLGTKPRKNALPSWENGAVLSDHYHKSLPPSPDAELENRRTFLSCYIMCSESAMTVRRSTIIRFNNWIADCVEFIDRVSRVPSDRHLIAWARLCRLCEEITTSFGYDSDLVSLSELRVQLMLKSFEKRLENWNRDLEHEVRNGSVKMMYHKATLYLHELAIHDDHPPEDFKPPWHIEKIDPMKIRSEPNLAVIDATATCISAAQSLLSVFLSMSTDTIRSLPTNTFFAGVVYAAVILMKIDISASDPASKLGQYIDRTTLKVKWYLEAIERVLKTAVGNKGYRVPSSFLGLLMKFRRNYDAKYSLWGGIAWDDHQYDVMTDDLLPTDPSGAIPPDPGRSTFVPGDAWQVDAAVIYNMNINYDADVLDPCTVLDDFGNAAGWQEMGFANGGNSIADPNHGWT